MVTIDEREKRDPGALIAIDEIDETGRIIRTSTVREKFVPVRSADAIIVDIGRPCSSRIAIIDDENNSYCHKLMSDSDESRRLHPSSKNSVAFRHYRMKKRKTQCKLLTDVDISRNVISLRRE